MTLETGPIYDRSAYAGFWRRTLALLIDLALLNILWWASLLIWYNVDTPAEWHKYEFACIRLGTLVVSLVYLIGLRMTDRGTLGYRIMRIQYAYAFDRRPTWLDRVYRAILAVVLLWFFLLDHIWIIFDERKQAWHDKVSGFYVIKRGAQPIGSTQIVRRMIDFMMLSFPVIEPVGESTPGSRLFLQERQNGHD